MRPLASLTLALAVSCAALGCASSEDAAPGLARAPEGHAAVGRDERQLGMFERQPLHSHYAGCGRMVDGLAAPICWTSALSPARDVDIEADDRYLAAAVHRRVSQALRDAEATACDGIPIPDRVESPFAHREDIVAVQVLPLPDTDGMAFLGARVVFRDVPGLTVEWLQRVVDCHLARDAALGHDVPEMSYCPLVPAGAHAKVTSGDGGYVIEVRSDDGRAAREIARRAQALWP